MNIPQWALLGFAGWTLLLLMATVGVYRWGNILFAKAAIASFRYDAPEGGWYLRGTRAHANALENLPVFGGIVYLLSVVDLHGPLVDALCLATLAARIVQSCVHIAHAQTNAFVAVRFSFYSVQLVSFLVLIVMVVKQGMST